MTEAPFSPFDLAAIRTTFVRPFYLQLNANLLLLPPMEAADFCHSLVQAEREISDDQIEILLNEREWRGRLTAAWFIGIGRRTGFVSKIAALLLASEVAFAGAGYCLALSLIRDQESSVILRAYLDKYLPLNGRVYDQAWALGALAHLEGQPPARYLDPALWRHGNYSREPMQGVQLVAELIAFLLVHRVVKST